MWQCNQHGEIGRKVIRVQVDSGRKVYCVACVIDRLLISDIRDLGELEATPVSSRVSLDKPTGTAETITVDKTLEQASSVSATFSYTVGKTHG